ncbi:hypothetical protein N312_08119, partial [Balearica regulorum gibbericeps]
SRDLMAEPEPPPELQLDEAGASSAPQGAAAGAAPHPDLLHSPLDPAVGMGVTPVHVGSPDACRELRADIRDASLELDMPGPQLDEDVAGTGILLDVDVAGIPPEPGIPLDVDADGAEIPLYMDTDGAGIPADTDPGGAGILLDMDAEGAGGPLDADG